MKHNGTKFVLVVAMFAAISLSDLSECKAHLFANLFGYGYQSSYRPTYYPPRYGSAYRGYGFSGYRSTYYAPASSCYHAPVNYGYSANYGYGVNYGNNVSYGYSDVGCGNSCGCSPCADGCSVGGCNSCGNYCGGNSCVGGNCATGQSGVQSNSGSSINSTYDNGDNYKNTPTENKGFKRTDDKENIDDTGSKEFGPPKQNEKKDNGGAFGDSPGLNSRNFNESGDGTRTRTIDEQPTLKESPVLPADETDLFNSTKERDAFKISPKKEDAKTEDAKKEEVDNLDKIMDDHNKTKGDIIKKRKGAPTKNPVDDDESTTTKKQPAEMPRLEVEPIGLGKHIAWKTIPTYRRLLIRSRYSAPQIARTRVMPGLRDASPVKFASPTKLVSK